MHKNFPQNKHNYLKSRTRKPGNPLISRLQFYSIHIKQQREDVNNEKGRRNNIK